MSKTETAQFRNRWDVIALLSLTALVAITLVPAWGVLVGYAHGLWVWFAIFLAWNGLSITAGYHRLWSHRSYVAHPLVRVLFALGGALSLQNSILEWCSNHRKHHRYVDNVDLDPYAAPKGLFYAHVGWMLKDYPATEEDYSNVRDLQRDPIVNLQFQYYWYLSFIMNVCVPLVIGSTLGDPIGGFLLLGVARLVICHHTTFCINSLAHAWGSQPYSDEHHGAEDDHGHRPCFDPSIDEDQKGDEKPQGKNGPGQILPREHHDPLNNEAGLLGYIAVPDHDQLTVKEIAPQQAEGEKQFSQVMKLS